MISNEIRNIYFQFSMRMFVIITLKNSKKEYRDMCNYMQCTKLRELNG